MMRRMFLLTFWVIMLITVASVVSSVQFVHAQLQPCPPGTGPGGIKAGGYAPQDLTQEQRQWLYQVFGHDGIAPVGYGGQACGDNPPPPTVPPWVATGCNTTELGPGGIRVGGYDPKTLTREQRQWLWEKFGHPGYAPEGYGGEFCQQVNGPGTNAQPQQPNPPQQSGGNSGGGNPNPQPQGNSSGSDARYPDAQEPAPGVKVPIICQHWGHTWSSSEPGNAYGWTCDDGFRFGPAEFSQACRDAWGSALPYATLANWRDKYGWRCVSSPGYVDPYGGSSGNNGNSGQQPQASGCDLAQPSQIASGMIAQVVTDELNIRSQPSLSGSILETLHTGDTVTIIGGPVCGDGYRWWKVKHFITGWMADSDTSEIYLAPVVGGGGHQTVNLGRGCSDNGDGTVTCTAIGVKADVAGDPFVGVFELSNGVGQDQIIGIWFHARGGLTLSGTLLCGSVDSFVPILSQIEQIPQSGFYFAEGCVHGIEFLYPGSGRDEPNRWELKYRVP